MTSAPILTQSPNDTGEIDLSQIFSMFWSGRYVLLSGAVIGLLFGSLYLTAAQPIYEADGIVQVEQNGKSSSNQLGELATLFGSPMETEAEIQIIRSRMVLGKVIEKLKLDIEASPIYFPIFGNFIARTRNQKKRIAADPLFGMSQYAWSSESIDVQTFNVPTSKLGKIFVLTALAENKFSLIDSDKKEILQGKVGVASVASTDNGPIEIFVQDLVGHPGTQYTVTRRAKASVLQTVGAQLTVSEAGKQSGVISLSLDGPSPNYVANVVKEIEDAYLRQNVERRSAEAQQSLEFLQQQLPELRARVDAAQVSLNNY